MKRPFNCLENPKNLPPIPQNASPKWAEAQYYLADADLVMAMQVAIAMHQPLFLTGAPGCGKTSAPYWAAMRLGLSPSDLIHIQIRSDSTAAKLKYEFDAVRYLRESQIAAFQKLNFNDDLERFFQKGLLWTAFEISQERPIVLLLDEIDKAPRDLPNDLLREFDSLEFEIPEWPERGRPRIVRGQYGHEKGILLIIFTSNGERQLPDAFLRRCLHHHLSIDERWIRNIVQHRIERKDIQISQGLLDHAIKRFLALKQTHGLRHSPSMSEFLVWLKIIALVGRVKEDDLANVALGRLPYLGALLKDPKDLALIAGQTE